MKTRRRCAPPFFSLASKNLRGAFKRPPPPPAGRGLTVLLAAAVYHSLITQHIVVAAASPGTPSYPVLRLSVTSKSWTSNRPSSPPETTAPGFLYGGWSWAPPVAGNRSDVLLPPIPAHHTRTHSHAFTVTTAGRTTYTHGHNYLSFTFTLQKASQTHNGFT